MANKTQNLIIGNPVEPMLVLESGDSKDRYADIIKQHDGKSYVEVKSDGHRIQVHNNGKLSFFTRNLNSLNPELYPEVLKQLQGMPNGIFDGELVGLEDGIQGFNAVKNRKKQTLDYKLVKEFPLQVKFFDVLNLNGDDMIDRPLYERRKTLKQYFGNVSEQWTIEDAYNLKEKFLEVTDERCLEGVVCKNPSSKYLIGKRTKDWIKLKKFLSLDLVVLGVYAGEGKASKLPFAALLLGTQNNGYYETLTKVGIAKKDIIAKIEKKVKQFYTTEAPANVRISEAINKSSYERKKPLYFIKPENSVVVEVETLNITKSKNWHSCGLRGGEDGKAYSLRIPIVQRYRDDKTAKDIATTKQIAEIYNS